MSEIAGNSKILGGLGFPWTGISARRYLMSRTEYTIVARQLLEQRGRDKALRYADSNIRAQKKLGNQPGVKGWQAIKREIERLAPKKVAVS